MLLEIDNVHVHYHKVAALKGIDMAVPEDGIVTIIGANGAGKSTTLRSISGLVRISDGEIRVRRRNASTDFRRRRSWRSASPTFPKAAACFPT